MNSLGIIGIIIVLAIVIAIILIGREIVCWYFKINERLELLKDQNHIQEQNYQILFKINNNLKYLKGSEVKKVARRTPSGV